MKLARFNDKGIVAFRRAIDFYRKGETSDVVCGLLESTDLIEPLGRHFTIRNQHFETRLDLAKSVEGELSGFDSRAMMQDTGLWSWLSAALFDEVCPPDSNGNRKPGEDYRHIPSESHRHFYRHLIRGPVRTLNFFKGNEKSARIIFCQPPHKPGDFVEQLASRQERVTSPAVIHIASELYFDELRGKPKVGVLQTEVRPGNLRRYLNVLDQLELTYDLYSILPDDLISLLPNDFERTEE